MKKYATRITLIVLSYMGLLGMIYINKFINNSEQGIYNNPLNIVLYCFIIYTYKNLSKNLRLDKKFIFSVIFSIVLSSIIVLGTQLEYLKQIVFEIRTIICIIFLAIDLFAVMYLIIGKVDKMVIKTTEKNLKKLNIIGYFTIFFASFLVFLAIYPGVFGYDSIYQLQSGLGLQETTEHYSVIYTYMISFVFSIGKMISGNYQLGCAIQVLIQIVFLSYVANKVCFVVYKISKNIYLWILSVIFFVGFTFYKIMVVSIAQDTIFTGFFVLFFLRIMKFVTDKEIKKMSMSMFIFIFIDVLGICLFRNNGFYALVLMLPFMYFIKKDKKIKFTILCSIVIPMIIYKLITTFVYPSIGIVKNTDSLKEMSSVPSQQLGRVLLKNPSVYSFDDLEKLKEYYNNIETLKNACKNNPSIADLQKNQLDQKKVNEDKIGYIKFWLEIGIKDTKNYIEAFLYNNLGLWYPNKNYPDYRMYHPLIEYKNTDTVKYNKSNNTNFEVSIIRESKLPIYEKVLDKIVNKNQWQKIPVISTIYTIGFYFVLLMFTMGVFMLRKQYKLLIPFSLLFSYYLTIFMGPVSLFRYVFPIIMLTPIYIMIIIKKDFCDERSDESNE